MHDYEFMMANLNVCKCKEFKNTQSNSQKVKSTLNCIHNNTQFCEKVLNYLKIIQQIFLGSVAYDIYNIFITIPCMFMNLWQI